MFKLPSPDERYPTDVQVMVPSPSGKPSAVSVEVSFRHVPTPELDGLTDAEVARLVVAGWSGIADHDGKALAFSPEALGRVCGVRWFVRACVEAYLERFDPPKT